MTGRLGAVDPRSTIRKPTSVTAAGVGPWSPASPGSSRSSNSPTRRPMSSASMPMVDSAGTHWSPISKSPKPRTDRDPGTAMPRRRHSISAPKAARSEIANTASSGPAVSSRWAMAAAPPAKDRGTSPRWTMRSVDSPASRSTSVKPVSRASPRKSWVSSPMVGPIAPMRRWPSAIRCRAAARPVSMLEKPTAWSIGSASPQSQISTTGMPAPRSMVPAVSVWLIPASTIASGRRSSIVRISASSSLMR